MNHGRHDADTLRRTTALNRPGQCYATIAARGWVSRTTHLVLAGILAFGAANAEGRRGLGSDSVDPLEAGMADVLVWAEVLIMDDSNTARSAREWVSNRHGEMYRLATR